mmetsp:Transcript_18038/g.37951  ORF Transcript_18038/g.37951 Transcript_18038/m.37951 type:complete len:105 (+) Transcript_18038:139-453(+)
MHSVYDNLHQFKISIDEIPPLIQYILSIQRIHCFVAVVFFLYLKSLFPPKSPFTTKNLSSFLIPRYNKCCHILGSTIHRRRLCPSIDKPCQTGIFVFWPELPSP